MEAVIRLETLDRRLKDISMLRGIGFSSNAYVLGRSDVTLIDTGVGDKLNAILPRLKALKLEPKDVSQIILTHSHPDHTGGLEEILKRSSAKVLVHPDEALDMARWTELKEGDTTLTEIGPLTVLHTPGHTSGSLCLYEPEERILFSGDTVFPDGSFGRTDMPTGDDRAMLSSLKRLSSLEVQALLPGHGNPLARKASEQIRLAYEMAKRVLSAF